MHVAKRNVDLSRPLVTTPRAAELLGVSPKTVEDWRLKGRGPRFIRLGKAIRYSMKDLEDFVAASVASSTSDQGGGRVD